MTEFINLWRNYANFSARTTRKGYWMAILFYAIISIVIAIIAQLIGPELPNLTYTYVNGAWVRTEGTGIGLLYALWLLASIVPILAVTVRRLRDIGKRWTWIFLELIPLVGATILIVWFCRPSIEDNGTPVV